MSKKYEDLLHRIKSRSTGFPESDFRRQYYSNDSSLSDAVYDLIKLIEASHNELLDELKKTK